MYETILSPVEIGGLTLKNRIVFAPTSLGLKGEELEQKIRSQKLNLNDFLEQMRQISKMGSMEDILGMLPGGNKLAGASIDEKQLKRTEAIITSMTNAEREEPSIINGSRRKRIAAGSGTSVQDVNRLLNQFEQMKKMMKMMTGKGKKRRKGMMGLPF